MRVVHDYVHHNKDFGILVQFEVGTDFTSRTTEFKALAERVVLAFSLNEIRENPTPYEGPLLHPPTWRIQNTTMVDSEETVEQVLEAASKLFKEPIRVTRLWDTRDGV